MVALGSLVQTMVYYVLFEYRSSIVQDDKRYIFLSVG